MINEINRQIDELRDLKVGWLDGIGFVSSTEDLDWFSSLLEDYPETLLVPRIYPIPEGGVLMEWSIGTHEISLEFDLAKRCCDYHDMEMISRDVRSVSFPFSQESWNNILERLKNDI